MEYFHRGNSSYEKKFPVIVRTQKLDIVNLQANTFTYRTEAYLQHREKQVVSKSPPPSPTITTWRNLKYQKRFVDKDQAELDRVLSTMDSIHGTFNRSLLIPFNQVYASLYGDDDKSARLMKTFCQRQDHYMNYDLSMKDDDNTQEMSNSYGDFDDETEDEEEKENGKKNSYDSGYGTVMPIRQFSRGLFFKTTQPLSIN